MKNTFQTITLILALIWIAGCGGGSREARPVLKMNQIPATRVGETTPSGIKLGGVLRINEAADPRSLDPVRTGESVSHNITKQIYDALMEFDNDLNLHPGLAKSYEVSDDGRVYTFHLQDGVRFHDDPCFPGGQGRELTAEDVKYSLTRVLDPKALSTGAWIFLETVEGAKAFNNGDANSVSGFKVVDDKTFEITLNEPFGPFIYRVAMTFTFIHPPEAVQHYGNDFFQNPVGTGPYQFVHWKPSQEIVLKRNPHYWRKDDDGTQLPYLDGIRFTLLPDYKTEFFELETGGLDSITSIHEDLWSRVFDKENNLREAYQKYRLQKQDLFVTQYYGFNLNKEPFKGNKTLRQALNYAIDRESFIRYVLNGRGVPARGIVPHNMPGYESKVKGYDYDLEKAKSLLAEAGYPNGEGLPPLILHLNSGGTSNENLAEAIQGQLDKAGIQVELKIIEWSQHLNNLDEGKTPFFRLGWIADYPDPENFLQLMWSRNFAPEGSNYSFYDNPEFDRLFEEAIRTTDEEKRMELYQQAEQIAMEDAPWLFLFYSTRYRLQQKYVHNLELNPQEFPLTTFTWLEYDIARAQESE